MNRFLKKSLHVTAAIAAAITACLAIGLACFVYPGTPGKSKLMTFDGYIDLPKGGMLNVLDYLTLSGNTLFVTSESSGALFKVNLDLKHPPVSSVSVMPGSEGVQGVALLIDQTVAFVTRSEENTADVFDPQSIQVLGRIPVADDADAILFVPSANLVYVANGGARLATLIDPVKRAIVGAIQLPGKPAFPALDPKTGLLYQNLKDIDSISAIDLGKRSIVGQWSLAPCDRPSGMAIDPDRRRYLQFAPEMHCWRCLT